MDFTSLSTMFHKWGPWAAVLMMFHSLQEAVQSTQVTVAQNTAAINTLIQILNKGGHL